MLHELRKDRPGKLHFRMFLRSLDANTTGFISLEMKNIAKKLLETVEMNPFRHTRERQIVCLIGSFKPSRLVEVLFFGGL